MYHFPPTHTYTPAFLDGVSYKAGKSDTPPPTYIQSFLEFNARLKRNHARSAVAAQTDSEQTCRGRSSIGERTKTSLRGGLAGNARQSEAGKTEIGMIEDIEELNIETKLDLFGDWKPFR